METDTKKQRQLPRRFFASLSFLERSESAPDAAAPTPIGTPEVEGQGPLSGITVRGDELHVGIVLKLRRKFGQHAVHRRTELAEYTDVFGVESLLTAELNVLGVCVVISGDNTMGVVCSMSFLPSHRNV